MSERPPLSLLPTDYRGWRLQSHEVEFDDAEGKCTGVVWYEYHLSPDTAFSIYIESEAGGWGGALIDIGEPENPHRDAISTFEAETITGILEHAKHFMDQNIEKFVR